MREHPTENNRNTEAWSLNGDLFYRKEDKKPFQTSVQALQNEEKSLIVVGDEGILDHYCRMLISRLKDIEQFHLEVFLSTSKDGLLKRFNQMLANMSIDEARQPASADTSVHLLVINDAGAVKDQEWTLLIRLIRDFPGANVRVALFVDKSSLSEFENRFEKLGKRVHRWTVHAPTLEEIRKLREIGKLKGYAADVEKMLLIAGLENDPDIRAEAVVPEPIIPESLITEPALQNSAVLEEVNLDSKSEAQEPTDSKDSKSNSSPRRMLLLTLALASSLLLFSRQLPYKMEGWSGFWKDTSDSMMARFYDTDSFEVPFVEKTLVAKVNVERVNLLEAIEISSEIETKIVIIRFAFSGSGKKIPKVDAGNGSDTLSLIFEDTEFSPTIKKEIAVNQLGTQRIEIYGEKKKTSVKIFQAGMIDYELSMEDDILTLKLHYSRRNSFETISEQPIDIIVEPTAPLVDMINSEERTDVADEASNSELNQEEQPIQDVESEALPVVELSPEERILEADDSNFFIQHIVFSEESQANDFVNSYQGLEGALIVPIVSGDNRFLAVLSGPFDSRKEAEFWAKEFQLPADFWIRNAGLLKRALVRN